jgi:hypothetical protein
MRPLGIPTVADRIAVEKLMLKFLRHHFVPLQ